MLDMLFPNFFGQGSSGGTNLSSGGIPEQIQGEDKGALAQFSSVPSRLTQADVDNMANFAGEIEGQGTLIKVWGEHALAAQQSALSNLDKRVTFADNSMRNEQQYRKKISKHGKNVLEHRIDVSATKANLDGFQRVLNQASQHISI